MDPRYNKKGDRLTNTIEECAELIHILCKVKRFGWYNYHPEDKDRIMNIDLVENEISDLEHRISLLKLEIKKKRKELTNGNQ